MDVDNKRFSLIDIVLTVFYTAFIIDMVFMVLGVNIALVVMGICLILYYYIFYTSSAKRINEIRNILKEDEKKLNDICNCKNCVDEKTERIVKLFFPKKEKDDVASKETLPTTSDSTVPEVSNTPTVSLSETPLPENELLEVVVEN
jgi:cbb3-type cytochrome oxidase subunit 3